MIPHHFNSSKALPKSPMRSKSDGTSSTNTNPVCKHSRSIPDHQDTFPKAPSPKNTRMSYSATLSHLAHFSFSSCAKWRNPSSMPSLFFNSDVAPCLYFSCAERRAPERQGCGFCTPFWRGCP